VEDDPIYQRLVAKVAEEMNQSLHICTGIGEASEKVHQTDYSLWVVDINLADGYGPNWVARQRRRGFAQEVLLLSHTSLEPNVNLADLQPCRFQIKPRSLDELRSLMKGWWAP
jgi:DNA-binding response OmpR family regulator